MARLKDDWRAKGIFKKPIDLLAAMARIFNRMKVLDVSGTEVGKLQDGTPDGYGWNLILYQSSNHPFRTIYNAVASSITVTGIFCFWWSGESDAYFNVYDDSETISVALPASSKFKCIYCQATLAENAAPTIVINATADAASVNDAVTAATAIATGNGGAIRILPIAVMNSAGTVAPLYTCAWYIGRES